jgi:hypothetical protein
VAVDGAAAIMRAISSLRKRIITLASSSGSQ